MGANDPLEALRRKVDEQVAERSLRHVAQQVGMTPAQLHRFLTTANPRPPTPRMLEQWYGRKEPEEGSHTSDSALDLLKRMVSGLPPEGRATAVDLLLKRLERAHTQARVPRPRWLTGARALFRYEQSRESPP